MSSFLTDSIGGKKRPVVPAEFIIARNQDAGQWLERGLNVRIMRRNKAKRPGGNLKL